VVYHGYQDIGVAVSVDEGLVVPVLRDADFMSIADVEAAIASFGSKARDKKLTIEEMTGGTFTVSNGGVFGSLLSTPILNPPQTGHSRHAHDSGAAHCDGWRGRHTADDVSRALL
jgi:2-oxoglutarate dehydrogenase E2 component (dihydrolipoamide succinyltransferase)